MVTVRRLSFADLRLLDPAASEWRSVPQEALPLQPTPLIAQPSAYVQASWQDRPHGVVASVTVQAAHDGSELFFRLSWQDETKDDGISDTDRFTDAAAVLFPAKGGDAPLTSMGSPQQPVYGWYWRPDFEQPIAVTAQGTGTTVRHQNGGLRAQASFEDGGWTVVLARRLSSHSSDVAALLPGKTGKVAFAVWQGANSERGGLKAVTMEWQPLEIEG